MSSEAIVDSGYKVLRGELSVPQNGGLCLQLVRLVVEDAFNMAPMEWYNRHRTHIVERDPKDDQSPWARDMERSLREQGMGVAFPSMDVKEQIDRYVPMVELVSVAKPGDLLFRWDVAKSAYGEFIGHVGVLMPGGMVLENINPVARPISFKRGPTSLTPLKEFFTTLVVRFNP